MQGWRSPDRPEFSWTWRLPALALLFLVSLLNYMDRFALGILLPAMKKELVLSDAELGVLAGGIVSMVYVIAALPLGRLADRYSKRLVIATAVAVWSVMTAICGLASNFTQLAIARILVGIGQAGATAPSNALIADLIPKQYRATGLSIYALGLPAGVLLSFLAGGLISEGSGWRTTLILFGLPGLLLAAAVAFALPDARHSTDKPASAVAAARGATPPMRGVIRDLLAKPSFVHVSLASGLFTVAWIGLLSWLPSFFIRTFALSVSEVGARLGLVLGLGQAFGILVGGILGDNLGRRDTRWYLWLCAAASLSATPFIALAMSASSTATALIALLPLFGFGLLQGAPAMAVVQSIAPPDARSVTASTYLLFVNVIGGFGSQSIGLISDWLTTQGNDRPLGSALTIVVIVCSIWSSLHFWIAARSFARDAHQLE